MSGGHRGREDLEQYNALCRDPCGKLHHRTLLPTKRQFQVRSALGLTTASVRG